MKYNRIYDKLEQSGEWMMKWYRKAGIENAMFDKVAGIITNYVEVKREDIKPESRFMEDLGFSSFDFMSMLGELEEELELEIEVEEAANIRTVQEAVEYLERIS